METKQKVTCDYNYQALVENLLENDGNSHLLTEQWVGSDFVSLFWGGREEEMITTLLQY